MTKADEFLNKQKGVRRSVLVMCIIWTTAALACGLYALVVKGLSGPDSAFLVAAIGLPEIPVAWYFQSRGKDDNK